jgi:preprotein translocase subunit SecY
MKKLQDIFTNKHIRKKILFTLAILAIYRLLVIVPVPFVDISELVQQTLNAS